jgi:NTP pyrophosphatase (non-canonical NTP hydrolase)
MTEYEIRKKRLEELIFSIDGADCWIEALLVELMRDRQKHPSWPVDAVHAAAVLTEETGELTQAALDFHYAGLVRPANRAADRKRMMDEAVQCGAMALRFLLALDHYEPAIGKGEQRRDAP